MNNCPKCGNPLQAGVTSCPICGTNISPESKPVQQTNNVVVNSVTTPVQTTAPASAPVQVVPTENVTKTEQPENKPAVGAEEVRASVNANAESTNIPTASTGETNNQVVTPVSTETTAPQPIKNNENNIEKAVEKAPEVNTNPVEPIVNNSAQTVQPSVQNPTPIPPTIGSIAPTIQAVEQQSPIPSIPSSLSGNNTTIVSAKPEIVNNAKVQPPKKKGNKTIFAVLLLVLLVAVGGGLYMTMGHTLKPNNAPIPDKEEIAMSSVTSNGYKFALPEGWLVNEDGRNVILTNTSETVAIKLDHSTSNIQNISKEMIESYMKNGSFENSEVTELSISAKDAYSINTKINDLPVQIYFIGGGTNLTLGVTIVYQSEDSKTKYESDVTEMIGTIAYSDDSIKAISTMDMYSDIFSIYRGVINNSNKPETPNVELPGSNGENGENPPVENNVDVNNQTPENNENNVQPENNNPTTPNENTIN